MTNVTYDPTWVAHDQCAQFSCSGERDAQWPKRAWFLSLPHYHHSLQAVTSCGENSCVHGNSGGFASEPHAKLLCFMIQHLSWKCHARGFEAKKSGKQVVPVQDKDKEAQNGLKELWWPSVLMPVPECACAGCGKDSICPCVFEGAEGGQISA